jgi:putative endopeptidase
LAIIDSRNFNPELVINLDSPAWLEKLNELYTEGNVPMMRAYLLYEKTYFTMQFLDEATYREYQKIDMAYEGADESESDESAAMGYAHTYLSQFVDKMYLQKYTSDKTRDDIIGVMRGIIAAYREMLREETWLTEETREQAIKKLDTMTLNAVWPDSWEDWSGYTFRSRVEGGNLMEATTELRRCQQELERKNSYEKPDQGIWPAGASSSVNARYNKQNNSINIYAGILNGDVYREDMTPEELLAGAGTIIAHEISHAFDTEGSQFDETGAFRDWWTDADREAFDRRAAKLIAYYDSLRPWKDGSPCSGIMVQAEAIADLGSMACIMRIAEKMENFDYDEFFRAYAELRRRKLTENAFENGFRTNLHPMDHLRVNVLLAQFPEFQETYDIQPGDGMYVAREDRIGIWGMPDNAGGETSGSAE